MAPKRTSREKDLFVAFTKGKSFSYWSIKEDAESYQYDQVKKVETSLVNVTNKIINNILNNGGEINHQGMCISSN